MKARCIALVAPLKWLGYRQAQVITAGVAKLVDALDLGSSDFGHGGSSPSARTKQMPW